VAGTWDRDLAAIHGHGLGVEFKAQGINSCGAVVYFTICVYMADMLTLAALDL